MQIQEICPVRILPAPLYFLGSAGWNFIDILSPSGGIVNQLLNLLGMDSVFFLGDPKVFPYTMAITDVWKELGWGTIVYLAAITGIDPTYYEAAKIDGANRFQQVFYVTIPSILSMILLMMLSPTI